MSGGKRAGLGRIEALLFVEANSNSRPRLAAPKAMSWPQASADADVFLSAP